MKVNQIKELVFKVDDVEQETELFETHNGLEQIEKAFPNKIAASIQDDKSYWFTYVTGEEYHQFLLMLDAGFNRHKPITISPDNLWLLICQGFAEHVKQNAWLLKHKLVNFGLGKRTITVEVDEYKPDWEQAIEDVCEQISSYTKKDIYATVVLDFSTTTLVEKTAFGITFMDAVSKYFVYEGTSICGFPAIKLTGEVADYQKMILSLQALKGYGLKWWIAPLIEILNKIIATLNGNVDRKFWQSLYRYELEAMSGGKSRVTGWITKFFPYVKNTKFWKLRKGMRKNPYLFGNYRIDLDLEDFPSGIAKVPFDWHTMEKGTRKLDLLAGFIGNAENTETGFLSTEINWIIDERINNSPQQSTF